MNFVCMCMFVYACPVLTPVVEKTPFCFNFSLLLFLRSVDCICIDLSLGFLFHFIGLCSFASTTLS